MNADGEGGYYAREYDERGNIRGTTFCGYRTGETEQVAENGKVRTSAYEFEGIGTGGSAARQEYAYGYEWSGGQERLNSVTLPGGVKAAYAYDGLGRVLSKRLLQNNTVLDSESYTYVPGGYKKETYTENGVTHTRLVTDRTTNYVKSVERGGQYGGSETYVYDSMGNIVTRTENGYTTRYGYDSAGRLMREDNERLGKSYAYEYDDMGNIVTRTESAYTTGAVTGQVRTYRYDGEKRLTGITENGVTTSYGDYDEMGNPGLYRGAALTWERGRQLASYGGKRYLYNAEGIRQEQTAEGGQISYYTDGSRIIAERRNQAPGDANLITYLYDASGAIGLTYEGTTYYYRKNLQGDICRVYTPGGDTYWDYVYDAWGNHKIYRIKNGESIDITTNREYNEAGVVNRLRYRGYYYDVETGLYYLNSRYYDPEVGRFINADDVSYADPSSINGLNLYSYCGNNPVMRVDPTGRAWWHWLVGGLIIVGMAALTVATAGGFGAALGAVASVFTSSMAVNAVAATFAGAFVGATLLAGTGVVVGGLYSMSQGGIFGDGASWGFMIGAGVGAVLGGTWGGTHYALQAAGKLPVKVGINSLVNNPIDEFVTLGPKDGGISAYVRSISETGKYSKIYASKLGNGTYQIANGHHRIAALRQLGYRFVNIYFV